MKKSSSFLKDLLLALVSGLLLGALLSVFSPGNFWLGWLGAGIISALLSLAVLRVIRGLKAGKTLIILMLVTFLLCLGLGIFLDQGLPVFGFDTPVQNAGYVFSDAFERDQAAYTLGNDPTVFDHDLDNFWTYDQYRGLIILSALIYRVFSPDIHRPLLMVLVSAFAMSLAVVFFYSAVAKKWNQKLARVSTWLMALYPMGVLLGSSQMREPILLALNSLLFWVSLDWKIKPVRTLIASIMILIVSLPFSVPISGASFVVIAGIVFIDWLSTQPTKKNRMIGSVLYGLVLLVAAVAGWMWLKEGVSYEYQLTVSNSGWISTLVDRYGETAMMPILTIYGLTQPVFPAAIAYPTLPIWWALSIFLSIGWYFVLPFLLYGFFAAFKAPKEEHRAVLVFLNLALFAWILISSIRGGGDQWDNPRYRTTFLPWMAILFGWVWMRIRVQKRPWFWRIVAMESVFVLVFLNWYLFRKWNVGYYLDYRVMLIIIVGFSLLTIIGGYFWDRKTAGKNIRRS